jgi:hypothetical protein
MDGGVARISHGASRVANRLQFQLGFGQTWIASTCVVMVKTGAARIERALAAADIDTRRWWGDGAHTHPATAAAV